MIRAPRWALLAASVAVLAGCGSRGVSHTEPTSPVSTGSTNLSVVLSAASELLRLDKSGAQATSLVVRRPGESPDRATVVATLDRLPDDSVRAVRYVLTFDRRADGTWHPRSAVRGQRCWPHRGHQDFSHAPCI